MQRGAAVAAVLSLLAAGAAGAGAGPPPAGASGPAGVLYRHLLNGGGDEAGRAIAIDRAGNTYVAGETSSPDFPVTQGARRAPASAARAAFVAKLDASGRLLWSTTLGGSGVSAARGIAVGRRGRVYVAGATNATDFPTTRNALQRSYGGGPHDGFVTALDRSGRIVYSTFLGDTHYDEANAITVDPLGRAIVAGRTVSPQFSRVGHLQPPVNGGAFVATLSPAGSRLVFSTVLGGNDRGNHGNTAFAVALDRRGALYTAGVTNADRFPVVNALQPRRGGGADAFVTKISPSRTSIVYSTYLGGAGEDSARAIAADPGGYAYVTGVTASTNFPFWQGAQSRGGGGGDAFVAKIEQRGATLRYATSLGGSGDDDASAIAVTPVGDAYVTGRTASADFPLAGDGRAGGGAFVSQLGRGGARLEYSSTLDTTGAGGLGVAVDRFGVIALTGRIGATAPGAALVMRLAPTPSVRLRRQLVARGTAASLGRLLGAGGAALRIVAPASGRLRITWYAGRRPVARGVAAVSSARPQVITLRLTAAGRRVLAHRPRIALTARAVLTRPGGAPIAAATTFVATR